MIWAIRRHKKKKVSSDMLSCALGGVVYGVSKDRSAFKTYAIMRPTTERNILEQLYLQQFRCHKLKPRRSKRFQVKASSEITTSV